MSVYYRQCQLKRESVVETAWIPEQLARVGKHVKIKNDDGEWTYGWHVFEVGSRQPEEFVLEHERDYWTSRRATDAVRDSDGVWMKVR